MQIVQWLRSLCIVLTICVSISAATFTVSKDGGAQFTTIQAAIDAAGQNDIVRILDDSQYIEQVDIDSTKEGLTLTSADPASSNKPAIIWKDTVHIHPQNHEESLREDMIDYDRNGALRLLSARKITIDGLRIEGGGPYVFGGDGIWEGRHSLQHGNVAVVIRMSGDVVIRNCDISDAYIGIYVADRNKRGIFYNGNSHDLMPWNENPPFQGFSRTGNHLFEHNRIHNNSFGMFFQNMWNLGTTIRNNLFYENHHQTDEFAERVINLTSDGSAHPGGALWFKDNPLSPLAIHNNTFWHNYLIFCGHWRAGAQHLIFNNIYSTPHTYWAEEPNFPNPYHTMDKAFVNRMKNCIYAAQSRRPVTDPVVAKVDDPSTGEEVRVSASVGCKSRVFIMNDINGPEGESKSTDVIVPLSTGDSTVAVAYDSVAPGALITDPFPAESKIRWLETDYSDDEVTFDLFKSTDPSDPEFLEPDWDNPLVQQFILDRGWQDAGIRDRDGSIADLGAISSAGTASEMFLIKPASPVVIRNQTATLKFDLIDKTGELSNPTVIYFRFIELEFDENAFGGNTEPVPEGAIHTIPVGQPVRVGSNELEVTVPVREDGELYACFEMIVEATGSMGEPVASTVGFLPYRDTDFYFDITVFQDSGQSVEIDTVRAGDTVYLNISAFDIAGTSFSDIISPIEVTLNSSAPLFGLGCDLNNYPGCSKLVVDQVRRSYTTPVIFTKVPEGGVEYVAANGIWRDPADSTRLIGFFGASKGITILAGSAKNVVFQNPPSNTISAAPPVIDPGTNMSGWLEAYDRFENRVKKPAQIRISSLHPEIGNVVGGVQTINTDSNGVGTFTIEVTNGENDSIFTLQAEIEGNIVDQADMKVGRSLDKLWVFYGDTASFDPTLRLEGEIGQRLPVQIWASADGEEIIEHTSEIYLFSSSPDLLFYEEEDAQEPATEFQMTDGKAVVWVTSNTPLEDAMIGVGAVSSIAFRPGRRDLIYFDADVAVQRPDRNRAIPYELTVKAGPNPFVQGTALSRKILGGIGEEVTLTDGVIIEIAPQPEPQRELSLNVFATINDALGNKIASCSPAQANRKNIQLISARQSNKVYLIWNGLNQEGRPVGAGTYAAFIVVRDPYGKEERFVTKIGVQER